MIGCSSAVQSVLSAGLSGFSQAGLPTVGTDNLGFQRLKLENRFLSLYS
jgi:hypothetical protein